MNKDMENRLDKLAPATVEIGETFYAHLLNGNYEKTSELFSLAFMDTHNKQELDTLFSGLKRKYGSVKTVDFLGTKFTSSIENGKTSYYVSNEYKVFYSTGYLSKERLTFLIEKSTKNVSGIDGYTFLKFGSDDE